MKFIHTADWQIGKPFVGIEDENSRALLQHQRIETIRKTGDVAREHGASFVVVAGDMFDSNTPDKGTVSALCSAVGSMDVPVYVIPGNHDAGGPGTVYEQDFFLQEAAELAPDMRILLEAGPVETGEAIILPCPFIFRSGMEDPLKWLSVPDVYESLPPGLPRIVLAHGSVMDFSDSDDENLADAITLDLIPLEQVDYVALGDWHGTKQVEEKAWYSGTHEQDRYPKGEDYQPGNVLVVEVKRGALPDVQRVHVGGCRWHSLEKEIHSDDQLALLSDEINGITGREATRDLLRMVIRGRLSMKGFEQFDSLVETWRARLMDLRLKNYLEIAPDDQEIEALSRRSDPMISAVASQLSRRLRDAGDERERKVATIALLELYSAVTGGGK